MNVVNASLEGSWTIPAGLETYTDINQMRFGIQLPSYITSMMSDIRVNSEELETTAMPSCFRIDRLIGIDDSGGYLNMSNNTPVVRLDNGTVYVYLIDIYNGSVTMKGINTSDVAKQDGVASEWSGTLGMTFTDFSA